MLRSTDRRRYLDSMGLDFNWAFDAGTPAPTPSSGPGFFEQFSAPAPSGPGFFQTYSQPAPAPAPRPLIPGPSQYLSAASQYSLSASQPRPLIPLPSQGFDAGPAAAPAPAPTTAYYPSATGPVATPGFRATAPTATRLPFGLSPLGAGVGLAVLAIGGYLVYRAVA